MDSISLGSHIFSSSQDWVRSGARTKNVATFFEAGEARGTSSRRYLLAAVHFVCGSWSLS